MINCFVDLLGLLDIRGKVINAHASRYFGELYKARQVQMAYRGKRKVPNSVKNSMTIYKDECTDDPQHVQIPDFHDVLFKNSVCLLLNPNTQLHPTPSQKGIHH